MSTLPTLGPSIATVPSSNASPKAPDAPDRANRLILSYLESRGYHRAAEALRCQDPTLIAEETRDAVAHNKQDRVEYDQELRSILHNLYPSPPSTFPQTTTNLETSYRVFSHWVSSSLDIYQPQLQSLLFPILCHIYLKILAKNPQHAHQFLTIYGQSFLPFHKSTLQSLSLITQSEQTKRNPISISILQHKMIVYLNSNVFHLALDFISSLRIALASPLLKIINEHCTIKIDQPLHGHTDDNSSGGGGGGGDIGMEEDILGLDKKELEKDFLWGELAYEAYMFNDDGDDVEHNEEDEKKKKSTEKDSEKKEGEDDDTGKRELSAGDVLLEAPIPLKKHRIGEGKGIVGSDVEPKEKMARLWDDDHDMGLSVLCYTVSNTKGIGLNCAAVSNDGTVLAGGFGDSVVRTWDAKVGMEISPTRYVGHGSGVYGVGFSPCGQFLISGSADGGVRLWRRDDKGKQACLIQYGGHSSAIWDVEFARFGTYFVTGGNDRTARVWSTERAYPLRILAGHLSDVDCVAWHPNCGYIATGSGDGSVRVWDIRDGNCIRLLNDDTQKSGKRGFNHIMGMGMNMGMDQSVTTVAWETNGRRLACGKGEVVQIWDVRMGKVEYQLDMPGGCWSLSWAHEGGFGDPACLKAAEGADKTKKSTTDTTTPEKKEGKKEGENKESIKDDKKSVDGSASMEIVSPAKEKPQENSEKTDASKTHKPPQPRKIIKRSSAPNSAGKKATPVAKVGEVTKEADVKVMQSVLAAGGPHGVRCWNATTGSDMGMWRTKDTPVQLVQFNRKNLLIAIGAFGQY